MIERVAVGSIMKRRISILVVLFIFVTGLASGKDLELKNKIGEYNVEIRLARNPPIIGNNPIEIQIKDSRGQAINSRRCCYQLLYAAHAQDGSDELHHPGRSEQNELSGNHEIHHVRPLGYCRKNNQCRKNQDGKISYRCSID